MFVLWDPAALRGWLALAPTVPLRTDSARLDLVVAACRSAGYLVERQTPAGRRLYALLAGVSGTLPDELRALLRELVADIGERVYLPGENPGSDRHDISVISAPVFDQHRRQAMVLSLHIGHPLTDAEITARAGALVAAADRMTAQLSGAPAAEGPQMPDSALSASLGDTCRLQRFLKSLSGAWIARMSLASTGCSLK